jgi:nucleotide-binding universal stress UspA family protein
MTTASEQTTASVGSDLAPAGTTFKTIVLAVDGSDGAWAAIPLAAGHARRDGAALVIAHVEEKLATKGGAEVHADEQEIQADIRRLAKDLDDSGIDTRVEMTAVMGQGPAHAISEIAERADADLIVLGTRGHSAIAGAILGSVTQRLLHLAHRPVLVGPRPTS